MHQVVHDAVDKIFLGKLNTVLDEINENLYEDRSIS